MARLERYGHLFEDKKYVAPVHCNHCNEYIRVFAKGKRCTICNHNMHKKCVNMVLERCGGGQASNAGSSGNAAARESQSLGGSGKRPQAEDLSLHAIIKEAAQAGHFVDMRDALATVDKKGLLSFDSDGQTPLGVAIHTGNFEVVRILLEHMSAAEVNAKDKFGDTALHVACSISSSKNDKILSALLSVEGIKLDTVNDSDNTPLHSFCAKYTTLDCDGLGGKMVELGGQGLLLQRNKNGETALHKAIFNSQVRVPMIKFLLKAVARDPKKLRDDASEASDNDSDKSEGKTSKNDVFVILSDRARRFVNMYTAKGETALHYAIRLRRADVVELLLSCGADVNQPTQTSEITPLELANQEKAPQELLDKLENALEIHNWLKKEAAEAALPAFIAHDVGLTDVVEFHKKKELSAMSLDYSDSLGERVWRAIKQLKKERKSKKEKKEKRRKKKDEDALEHPPNFDDDKMNAMKKQFENLSHIKVSDGAWIDSANLEFLKELGAGASGQVVKGIYTHPTDQSRHDVAIKLLKEVQSDKELEEFKKEFQIFSAIESPFTVHFFGASLEPKLSMVMELCEKGSLADVLSNESLNIGWGLTLEWAHQLCKGVNALHTNTPQIVHRDLKTLNLLVTRDWVIKVCDFGLARFNTSSNLETLAKMRGTMAYCPPEAFFGSKFTPLSDVFSMGVILWEMVSRCIKGTYGRPYSEYPNLRVDFQIIVQVARKKKRPTIPESCPELLKTTIEESWAQESEERPSCEELVRRFEKMKAQLAQEPDEWNAALLYDPVEKYKPKPAKLRKLASLMMNVATRQRQAARKLSEKELDSDDDDDSDSSDSDESDEEGGAENDDGETAKESPKAKEGKKSSRSKGEAVGESDEKKKKESAGDKKKKHHRSTGDKDKEKSKEGDKNDKTKSGKGEKSEKAEKADKGEKGDKEGKKHGRSSKAKGDKDESKKDDKKKKKKEKK